MNPTMSGELRKAERAALRSKTYRPSNGTEGDAFIAAFCERCERDRAFREGTGDGCEILARTLVLDVDDPDYPTEWTYDTDEMPTCTAFVALGSPLPTERELESMGQITMFGLEAT